MKIFIWTVAIVSVLLTAVCGLFYRDDLPKEDLHRYLNEHSQFMSLSSGAKVHYRDEGSRQKPTLVMIHGGLGSLQNWDEWVELLKDDYRLISIDLLGHGLTGRYPADIYTRDAQRDMVVALLNELNINRFIIAGNSFGGGIALEIALAHAEMVSGLVLIASEGIPNSPDGYDASMFTDAEPVSPSDIAYTQISTIEKISSKFLSNFAVKAVLEELFYDDTLLTDDYVDYFARILRHTGNRQAQLLMFKQGLSYVAQHPEDLKPHLKDIGAPTLVIAGAEDGLVPLSVNESFHRLIDDSELVVIENAGHMPMIEKPQTSANAVIHFFKENHQ